MQLAIENGGVNLNKYFIIGTKKEAEFDGLTPWLIKYVMLFFLTYQFLIIP
jgi:hypothetical protein